MKPLENARFQVTSGTTDPPAEKPIPLTEITKNDLILNSTPENPLQIDLLTKKFSNIRSGAVTINSPRTLGKHKIPLDTSSINQPIISENNSTSKYKVLDYLESPWIECSTTGHVGHVQLHIQDEYSMTLNNGHPQMDSSFKPNCNLQMCQNKKQWLKSNDNGIQQEEY